jgi:glucokinase
MHGLQSPRRRVCRLQHVTYLRCADFAGVEDAYAHFLASVPEAIKQGEDARTPHVLSLAVAGPVNAELVEVSNNHWQFAKHQLMANLQLDGLLVINDFTAQSLAQSSILSGEIGTGHEQLLDGRPDIAAPLLVIGPGTGLGVSALIPLPEGPLPIEGEGGNIRFAPQTDIEHDLDAFMRKRTEHVIAEHLASGTRP